MVQNENLYKHLSTLTQIVLPLIPTAIQSSFLPSTIEKYPNLNYKESGFPDISLYPSIVKISQFFQSYGSTLPKIDLDSIPEFAAAMKVVSETPEIISYNTWPGNPSVENKIKIDVFNLKCKALIIDLIEYYYNINGQAFEENKYKEIYIPFEKFIYSEVLNFDISVPILFVKFETDYFELAPGVIIRRITDEVQRARYDIIGYSPAIVPSVFMSATHELVLKNYNYKRPANWHESPFSQPQLYPHAIIEVFFTILKITTDHTSGYAQLLIHPDGWAEDYKADLVPLYGASLHAYPVYFDDYFWNNKQFPTVLANELQQLADLFQRTLQNTENKLSFAMKRFYKSTLRLEEEDIIIDLIIALEILLGDSEKNEITHKLALRIAALLSYYYPDKYDPMSVFTTVKKIYSYRSSIVHGSGKLSEKREIKMEENITVPIVNISREYLRKILSIVIKEPKHMKAMENDSLLLQRRLI